MRARAIPGVPTSALASAGELAQIGQFARRHLPNSHSSPSAC